MGATRFHHLVKAWQQANSATSSPQRCKTTCEVRASMKSVKENPFFHLNLEQQIATMKTRALEAPIPSTLGSSFTNLTAKAGPRAVSTISWPYSVTFLNDV